MSTLNRRRWLASLAGLGAASVAAAQSAGPVQSSSVARPTRQEKPVTPLRNEDFYRPDGTFDDEKGKQAYYDLMTHYHVPISDNVRKNLWAVDFALGDFVHAGMGGIFWLNDKENGYFGHEIYLLPGQMIVEHGHAPTDVKAKHESWQVRNGFVYLFGVGEPSPEAERLIPESQRDHVSVRHVEILRLGEVASLSAIGDKHFMMAGPEGAIVTEYGSFHDGEGLRFTNPEVAF